MTTFVGDILLLSEALNSADEGALIALQNKWLSHHHWVINHPINPRTPTFARANLTIKNAHLTLFSDSAYDNRWCLVQVYDLADGVWVDGKALHFGANQYSKHIVGNISDLIANVENFDRLFESRTEFSGVLISHSRPAHFFFDQCKTLPHLALNPEHRIAHDKDTFFPLDEFAKELGVRTEVYTESNVYLVPGLIGGTPGPNDRMLPIMRSTVTERPLKDASADFILWISITTEKRQWLNQLEGYLYCIEKLAASHSKCVVLVDGFTANHGKRLVMPAENKLFEEMKDRAPSNVDFISLIGVDYYTKISYCKDATAFISYAGTPLIVPLRTCNKPGVIHSNRRYWTNTDKAWNHRIRMPELLEITEIPSKKWVKMDFINYTIEPQTIYSLLEEIMSSGSSPTS